MSCSLKEKILELDARIPRYTSYPTAPHFTTAKNSGFYTDWLEALPTGTDILLYLHIPFCHQLCWYCGCHTKITRRYDPVEAYIQLLLQEIDTLSAHIGKDKIVRHIHFGGGSPGILSPRDFACLMEQIRETFTIDKKAEIAIELDPRNVTEARVAAYAKAGVNRVSLGVQDFASDTLAAINRPQPFYLSYEAVTLLRSYGISGVNLDLMYGLPFQTVESIKDTVAKAVLLKPDRIAFFGYAHVPWVKKHMRLIEDSTLPDKDLRYDLFQAGAAAFEKAGYRSIGIDHFARENDSLFKTVGTSHIHRNFQGYTTDPCSTLIGLGLSAISKLPQGYSQNSPDMSAYQKAISNQTPPAAKYRAITPEDRLRGDVIERLMCHFCVDLPALCHAHGVNNNHFKEEIMALDAYQKLGFINIDEGVITVKPEAKLMARAVCAAFDTYLNIADTAPRHARAI